MTRARVVIALSVALMAGAARAQQPRSQPVCRPGFLRGSDGCVRASEPATAVFATEDSSDHFSVALETRSGPLRCADVMRAHPCTLRLEPEELRMRIEGDASIESTITVPRGGTMFRVETRGHGLLAGGLTLLAGGGAGVAAGFAVGSGGGFGAALALLIISVPSGVVALTGLAMSLVDLFRWHTRITTLPLSGPASRDDATVSFLREHASGYAMTPILSTPLLRF